MPVKTASSGLEERIPARTRSKSTRARPVTTPAWPSRVTDSTPSGRVSWSDARYALISCSLNTVAVWSGRARRELASMWLSLRTMLATSGELERAVATPAMKEQTSKAAGQMRADFTTRYRNFSLGREGSRFQSGLGDRDRGDACLQEGAGDVVTGNPGHFPIDLAIQ